MGCYVIATTGTSEQDEILLFTGERCMGKYREEFFYNLPDDETEAGNELIQLILTKYPAAGITLSEDGESMGLHKRSIA